MSNENSEANSLISQLNNTINSLNKENICLQENRRYVYQFFCSKKYVTILMLINFFIDIEQKHILKQTYSMFLSLYSLKNGNLCNLNKTWTKYLYPKSGVNSSTNTPWEKYQPIILLYRLNKGYYIHNTTLHTFMLF